MGATPSRRVVVEQYGGDAIMVTPDVAQQLNRQMAGSPPQRQVGGQRQPDAIERQEQMMMESRMKQQLQHAFNEGVRQGAAAERRHIDQEIRHIDLQWQNRLDDLATKREDELSQEFEETMKQFTSRFHLTQKDAPCQQAKQAIIQCYTSKPGRPLDCADAVQDFMACVNRARQVIHAEKRVTHVLKP